MDKDLIRERFTRAIPTYEQQATVQRQIAQHMVDLLTVHLPASTHSRVWEVGCGTGFFSRSYLSQHTPKECWLNDLCPEMEKALADVLDERTHFIAGDAEHTTPQGRFSLIVSCSSLQWLEQPFSFLKRCRDYLDTDGYLAFSLFGEENFREVKSLVEASLPYYSSAHWQKAANERGFQPIYTEEGLITLKFKSPSEVLRHLQQTGVTGIRREKWTKGKLLDFATNYQHRFSTPEGQVTLTYHPIYIILKNNNHEQ